jgi:GNAT superfamily N-acetyltransferase
MRGTSNSSKGRAVSTDLSFRIEAAKLEHGPGVYEVTCLANDFDPSGFVPNIFGLEDWPQTIGSFPEGQLVAVASINHQDKVIGVALSLRTHYSPAEKPLSWLQMIGNLSLSKHDPSGRWLYGVEKAVHPDFQGLGVGSALYEAQFDLIKRLNLRGMYAGGMLKGYKHYKDKMSIREYAGKVMRGEIFDPTVSVQMKKGFKPRTPIENYSWDHQANHTGMLIVYEAPRRSMPALGLGASLASGTRL